MQAEPKSASMDSGGVEGETRMFDWEQGGFLSELLARVRRPTALMSPCATSQRWRYLSPLIAPKS